MVYMHAWYQDIYNTIQTSFVLFHEVLMRLRCPNKFLYCISTNLSNPGLKFNLLFGLCIVSCPFNSKL
jgi:hypothetical protein